MSWTSSRNRSTEVRSVVHTTSTRAATRAWASSSYGDSVSRTAVLSRALAYATATRRSTTEVTAFLDRVSRQLELNPTITLNALKNHVRQAGYGTLDLTE